MDKTSYVLGMSIADNLLKSGVRELDLAALKFTVKLLEVL